MIIKIGIIFVTGFDKTLLQHRESNNQRYGNFLSNNCIMASLCIYTVMLKK